MFFQAIRLFWRPVLEFPIRLYTKRSFHSQSVRQPDRKTDNRYSARRKDSTLQRIHPL